MIDFGNFLTPQSGSALAAVGGGGFSIFKYFRAKREEKSAIKIGFLVEADRLLWVIKRHAIFFGSGRDDPLIPFTTDFYEKQIENIGKLPSDLVPIIVNFYGFVKFLNEIQKTRAEYKKLKISGFSKLYASQLQNFRNEFQNKFTEFFDKSGITRSISIDCSRLDAVLRDAFGREWNVSVK